MVLCGTCRPNNNEMTPLKLMLDNLEILEDKIGVVCPDINIFVRNNDDSDLT